MKRVKKKTVTFLIGLICVLIFTSISQYARISYPQNHISLPRMAQVKYSEDSLTAYLNSSLFEYSEDYRIKENVSSIDIDLGTPRWNVTHIEFNVTDMYFQNETKTVESVNTARDSISNLVIDSLCLGVQIEIVARTIIYGVYIFGENKTGSPTNKKEYLQIQGNDELTGKPNGTILKSVPLNISKSAVGPSWHLHKFPTPRILNKGIYYLVINCTDIDKTPNIVYDWYLNDENPIYSNLNISQYKKSTSSWEGSVPNRPYLYKLIQRVVATPSPKEINMTARINKIDHPFNDRKDIGTGNLSLSFKNFNPNSATLEIPIKNNVSDALIFNLSYYIQLNNSFLCNSKVLIRDALENDWTLKFNLDRFGFNYSVKFKYPNSWKNLVVSKNGITLIQNQNYSLNGNILHIFNETILDNSETWSITANTPNLDIELTVLDDSFKVGEELGFHVESPAKLGNYTFVLVDTIEFIKYVKTEERNTQERFSFNYTIPSNARSGEWTGFVYWNNATDAGVQTQIFDITGSGSTVIVPTSSSSGDSSSSSEATADNTPIIILAIFLIGGITSAVSISSYEGFKRLKKIRDNYRKKLFNQFKDLMNLNYIMITEKKSGLNIFEQYIAGQEIDATLISGFLNAIRAFGIELTKSNDQSQTISLEYKDSKVLMSEFKSFRIIVIMKERPSEQMINSITDLSYSIEHKYSEVLGHFKGNIVQFAGISDLIEQHLHTSFISPLKVVEKIDVKLTIGERAMINRVKEVMKEYNLNYFHSTYLISEQKFKPNDVETILKLINKKIFQPTSSESTGFKK